jgi:hypothetical protein
MRRRTPQNGQIAALEKIASEYERRQSTLFTQFHETWRGITMGAFRASLKAMVSRVKKTKREQRVPNEDHEIREPVLHVVAAETFSVDQTCDEEFAQRRAPERVAAESFSVDQTGDD